MKNLHFMFKAALIVLIAIFINNTNAGVVHHITFTVTPYTLPAANAGTNQSICAGTSASLGGSTVGGDTYSWSPSAGLSSSNVSNPTADPTITTTYTLIETVSSNGCQNTNSVTLTVNPVQTPTINIYGTEGNPVCVGAVRIRYYTESGKTNYTWIVTGGNITSGSSTQEIQVTWNNSGIDTVSVNYISAGCLSTTTKYLVTVNVNANVSLQPSPVTISTGKNTSFSITSNGIGLNYRWQVSTNHGTTYTNITNGGTNPVYSGSTTDSLSLLGVIAGNNGYLYRCNVTSITPCSSTLNSNAVLLTIISPESGLWDGGTPGSLTDWNTGSNWDDGNVPVSSTDVLIPSSATYQPILSGSGTCNSITINAKASLSVTGTLSCGDGGMLIKSDVTGTGAFTQSDAASVTVTGNVKIQRYLVSLGYHYIASPLLGITCNGLNGADGMTYTGGGTWYDPNHPSAIVPYPNMWRIDEAHTHSLCPSDYNSWYAPPKTETMTAGVGYAINIATGAKTISVSNTGSVINAGTYTASVSKEALSTNTIYNNDCLDQYGILNGAGCVNVGTGPTNGWHLVGNPYPSPVDWNALVNGGGVGTNIGYGISFFKPTTQWTGVYGAYHYFAGIATSSGAFNPGRYIPSMQSFFIQNNVVSTPALTFMNSYRSVSSSALNGNFYRSQEQEAGSNLTGIPDIGLYAYKENGSNLKDKTVIMFGVQSSEFSLGKLMNTDENVPNIYTISSNRELSMQGISEFNNDLIIPLGFNVNTAGNYIINAGEILNFPANTHIYLEDLKNKTSQDLTLNPAYSFVTDNSNEDNRFFLLFKIQNSKQDISSQMFDVYSNENVLIINYNNPDNAQATLSIYNILGQNIKNDFPINSGTYRMNLRVAPGTYLVKLVTNESVYIKKVYIQ